MAEVEVLDTRHPVPELPALVVHRVRVKRGEVHLGARSARTSTSSAAGPSPARTPRPT
jgi:hypothetical protein